MTKLNAAGSALVYSTFLGGSGRSVGSVSLDGAGNAWLAGGSRTPGLPDHPRRLRHVAQRPGDAIVAELNAAGSALVFGTFLGGTESDGASDIALDPGGQRLRHRADLSPPTSRRRPERSTASGTAIP